MIGKRPRGSGHVVRREIRYLQLDLAGALMEKPMVPMEGRYILAWREVGRAAGMHYRGFACGYGLDQRRRREETGAAAGARTWRRA